MYGPGAVGRGEWYVYDAEIGFPGLIIDGTECSGGEGEPLPLSESYEDMVAEAGGQGIPDAIGTSIEIGISGPGPDVRERTTTTQAISFVMVYYHATR